jgi:hypothetical protein
MKGTFFDKLCRGENFGMARHQAAKSKKSCEHTMISLRVWYVYAISSDPLDENLLPPFSLSRLNSVDFMHSSTGQNNLQLRGNLIFWA